MSDSARRIVPLAWPVFVGQIAVLAFTTIDTVLISRYAAIDLAALAVAQAAYITVFIGLMGVVLAVGPIVGQLYGARHEVEAGAQLHQSAWIALALAVGGGALLMFPQPFIALSQVAPEVEAKVRGYLFVLALSLAPALLFTSYRGFNVAVSRPKAVMALQLGSLVAKVPLSMLLIWGVSIGPLQIPALGVVGCALATCLAVWGQALLAWVLLRRDPFYTPFELFGRGLHAPDRKALTTQLRLGVPMGLSILVEVTGFTFMALFIARLGTTPVAGHQIAANLVALLFMMPLAIGNATGTLVAQRIGAQDLPDARRLGWHGLWLALAVALLMGGSVWLARVQVLSLYSSDAAVAAAALPLLGWLVWFHLADATQAVTAFVLRAWRIATVPLIIYATALWGIGLAGGYALATGQLPHTPASLLGAPGYWAAATGGLVVASAALALFLLHTMRRSRLREGLRQDAQA